MNGKDCRNKSWNTCKIKTIITHNNPCFLNSVNENDCIRKKQAVHQTDCIIHQNCIKVQNTVETQN